MWCAGLSEPPRTLTLTVPHQPAADSDISISDACREEVYQYKIVRDTNINANVPLGEQQADGMGMDSLATALSTLAPW